MAQYNRKDKLHQRAKEEGLRSRASFKLQEIQKRFKILNRGLAVLDLGAWPGGWLVVASQAVGPTGLVVGVDMVEIEPLQGVETLRGDVNDDMVIAQALSRSGRPFDVVLSDMSPKLTGIKEVDSAATTRTAELALTVAHTALAPGGSFVAKVFKSEEAQRFFRETRSLFHSLDRVELDATRSTSNEFYVIGKGFAPITHESRP